MAIGQASTARVCVLHSKPASGLTSFLKHAASSLANETCLTVYSNNLRQGSSLIFDDFFFSLNEQMESLSRKIERPEAFIQLARDTLSGGLSFLLPGGGMLKPVTEKAFDRIRSSYHSSEAAERFSRLATEHLRDTAIVFFLDNAQYFKADDLDVFRETLGEAKENVRFVLGYVDRGGSELTVDDLRDRILSVGQTVTISHFQQPDHLLTEDILMAAGVFESSQQARDLADATSGNAHRLVSAVRGMVEGMPPKGLSDLSADTMAVLKYIVAADQPLPTSVLAAASTVDPSVISLTEEAVLDALETLSDRSVVTWRTYLGEPIAVELAVDSADDILAVKKDRIAVLTARNSLYRAVVDTEREGAFSEKYPTALKYSLSLDVDPERSQRYAAKLVETAIRSGSIATAQLYADALPAPEASETLETFLITVALLIATRQYGRALEALDAAQDQAWTSNRIAQVYRAICLNRCRHHVEANNLLQKLLSSEELEPALVTVLGAVHIAGLLHVGELLTAKRSFDAVAPRARQADNVGYLLRNAAAVGDRQEALALLGEARGSFEDHGDVYGASTCVANIGSAHANAGNFLEASKAYRTALKALSSYGFLHMEETVCNLALIEIYESRLESASHRLEDMLKYATPNMPKLYAFDHMSLLQALRGKKDTAMGLLEDGDRLCDDVHVPVAQLRHRMNSILIRRFLEDPAVTQDDLAEITASLGPQQRALCAEIQSAITSVWNAPSQDDLLAAYRPGFLEYWSFDALGLLPGTLLPRIAVREDM